VIIHVNANRNTLSNPGRAAQHSGRSKGDTLQKVIEK
jgi:hypothetical protein